MIRSVPGRSLFQGAPFLFLTLPLLADPCREGAAAATARNAAQAEKLLLQCIAAAPARIEPYLLLSGVYQSQGNEQALADLALKAVKLFPTEKRFYLVAGIHAGRNRKFDQAIDVLNPAHKRWPGDEKIKKLLQSAELGRGQELLDTGANEQAAEHLRRAAQLDPTDINAQMNLGRALHNLHRNTEALAVFERLAQINPPPPLVLFHRGLSYHTLAQFDKAIADLNAELNGNPDHAEAYLVRGLALMSNGEIARALDDLQRAATMMPASPQAQYAYARCLLQAGNLEAAEEPLRNTMKLDASDPGPINALVSVLIRTGRAAEARPLVQKAAELSRQRRTAEPGEIRFESLRRPRP